ncbi:ras-related protein rab-32 [Stylonychia lemnae]|uniref:Ras-related protein rab-32 n=1 Tax=Stylonychia lemnae TaxID=5949 RepID=A0A077ZTW1_STYLE|nr:ras-related protein rab-32 [Stylonychia lemnae]|eukprot:CDW71886.1 ras-related protein rab-32 [Stylonychia lemnae]
MLKIVVVGDTGVGKTSIIRSFIQNTFDQNYRPTIGANFFQKSVLISGQDINLQFWDTTGSERIRSSFDIYLRGCYGAVLVEDYNKFSNPLTQHESLMKLKEWRRLLDQKTQLSDGRPIPLILLLNKVDSCETKTQSTDTKSKDEPSYKAQDHDDSDKYLIQGTARGTLTEDYSCDQQIETQKLKEILKIDLMFKTSAKTGENIKKAFGILVKEILKEGSYIERQEEMNKSNTYLTNCKSSLFMTSNRIETDICINKKSIKLCKKYSNSISQNDSKVCCSRNKCYN